MSTMMEYNGYHAKIEYDSESSIFVGEVFGIVDSLNFHGTTVEELTNMFHQCIDNYLEMCKTFGKEPNREFKGSFNVRVSSELHKKATLEAAKQNITLNQFVANAIEKAFDTNENAIKETVIYVPYSPQTMQWADSKATISNEYIHPGKTYLREENYCYV